MRYAHGQRGGQQIAAIRGMVRPGQTRRQRPRVEGQRGQPGKGRRPERSRAVAAARDGCMPLTAAGACPHLRRPPAVRQAAGPGRRRCWAFKPPVARDLSAVHHQFAGRCILPHDGAKGDHPPAAGRQHGKRPRSVRPSQAADVPCTAPGSSSAGSTSVQHELSRGRGPRVAHSQGEPHRGARPGFQAVDGFHQGQRCAGAAAGRRAAAEMGVEVSGSPATWALRRAARGSPYCRQRGDQSVGRSVGQSVERLWSVPATIPLMASSLEP